MATSGNGGTPVHRLFDRHVEMGTRDALTAALTRPAFLERAELIHALWLNGAAPYALLMLDLDHFTVINASHGLAVGDALIEAFAQLCHSTLRTGDIFGRWGGEKFVAILPESNMAVAMATAERIRMRTNRRAAAIAEDVRLKQSVSIGVAAPLSADARLEDVIDAADRALSAAKSSGRNRVCIQPGSLDTGD